MFSPVRNAWVKTPDTDYAWQCCRETVLFGDAVQTLDQLGAGRFLDLGPSGTLANFVRYRLGSNDRSAAALNRLSPNLDALQMLYRSAETQASQPRL
jgi:acyl transferase domain-containing protein